MADDDGTLDSQTAIPTPYKLAEKIIEVVLTLTGVPRHSFFGTSRTNYVSKVRDTIAFLIREHTDLSHIQIAEILKRKSHLISFSACRRETERVRRGLLKKIGAEQVPYAEWHKRVMTAVRNGGLQ